MSFPFHLPKEAGQTRQFDPFGTNTWQTYAVPAGATQLFILAVGGGGAGGNGFGAASGARGGGGGGGSAGIARILIPTVYLPGLLHLRVGVGVLAGAGSQSIISLLPSTATAAPWLVLANGGGVGGNGSAAAVGASGSAGAVTTGGAYAALGSFVSTAGQIGATGGAVAGATGPVMTFGAAGTVFVAGGAGGAGTNTADFAGGAVAGAGLCPTIPGGAAGSNPGSAGYELWVPPTFCGGSGGGSASAGPGGAGGAGGRGSGGGGGGAGTVSGVGGRGGDGFVLITALY